MPLTAAPCLPIPLPSSSLQGAGRRRAFAVPNRFIAADLALRVRWAALWYSLISPPTLLLRSIRAVRSMTFRPGAAEVSAATFGEACEARPGDHARRRHAAPEPSEADDMHNWMIGMRLPEPTHPHSSRKYSIGAADTNDKVNGRSPPPLTRYRAAHKYTGAQLPHIGMCGKPASRPTKVEKAHRAVEAGGRMFDPYGAERHSQPARQQP